VNAGVEVPTEELWVRFDGEQSSAYSLQISAAAATGCETKVCEESEREPREPEFEGASADGSRAFFISEQQLTDGASQGSENLYESVCEGCEEATEAQAKIKRRLIDVSEGAKEHGGPQVKGVVGVGTDSDTVYFVAGGVLTGEANERGEVPQNGADNLYGYVDGHMVFIAALSPADVEEWEREAGLQVANVTPDGSHLVFVSHRALTADDTRSEIEETEAGEGAAQVFEYDASTGDLVRVSVGQDGYNDDGNDGTGNAIIVAGSAEEEGSVPVRLNPAVSNDGSIVFFRSPVALTPKALNDVVAGPEVNAHGRVIGLVYAQNLYEYREGRVSLISDGKDVTAPGNVNETEGQGEIRSATGFFGADATGVNVFFSTFEELVSGDTDSLRDYYDARVCSEAEPCVEPAGESSVCGEGVCQGAGSSVLGFGVPSSMTSSGAGDAAPPAVSVPVRLSRAQELAKALKGCRVKKSRRKRAACEALARKRYGAAKKTTKAKKATKASKSRARGSRGGRR
jgi:hypothetical protein